MIRVAGYPRSGNFFGLHALSLLYNDEVRGPFHTTAVLRLPEANNATFVVFRNPVDCIAAWHDFDERGPHARGLDADVDYYLRYTQAVLDNAKNVTLLDFEKFTVDVKYIADKAGRKPKTIPTMEAVRESLRREGTESSNLPNPIRYANREALKAEVLNHTKFAEVAALHAALQKIENGA